MPSYDTLRHSAGGGSAGIKFWERLVMFGGTTLYAVATVYIFDAIVAARRGSKSLSTANAE